MRRLITFLFATSALALTSANHLSAAPLAAPADDSVALQTFPIPQSTHIVDFDRDSIFANYFSGPISYAVKIYAATSISTTLRVERKSSEGSTYNPQFPFTTVPVTASAGQTVTVYFTSTPTHPCWGEEFRLTLLNTPAAVRIGRMDSTCTYESIVTDSWEGLSSFQKSMKSVGKLAVDQATMTEDPVCGARLRFTTRVTNNTSETLEGVRIRWSSKGVYHNMAENLAPGASRTFSWQEPPGDWFDDGSNESPRNLAVETTPDLPQTDRVWTKEIDQSCILRVGLE